MTKYPSYIVLFVRWIQELNPMVEIHIKPRNDQGQKSVTLTISRWLYVNKGVTAELEKYESEFESYKNVEAIAQHDAKYLLARLDEETNRLLDKYAPEQL